MAVFVSESLVPPRHTWAQTVQRQDTVSGDFIVITRVFTLPHSGQTSDGGCKRLLPMRCD